MEQREIGSSGIRASAVGLGTWAIGGWWWGGTDEQAAVRGIQAAVDAGITLIDTAPAYGLGLSEELVGKAIAGRRDRVVLATKCGLVWHARKGQHFFDEFGKPVHRYLGAESLRYELEQSLKRLRTEAIDLYQTHWQDPTTPIAETMDTLLALKKEGKIRAIGVSNISTAELAEYLERGPVDSAQENYSMLDRGPEKELLPFCRRRRISLLAYSPLALGLLTGKIGPERSFEGDDLRRGKPRFSPENLRLARQMLGEFQPIAEGHRATIAQLVIAWTIARPGITFALVGARNPDQARENAAAGEIRLSEQEVARMDGIYARYAGRLV